MIPMNKCLLLWALMAAACSGKAMERVSVMTFNVRYNNPDDAPNNWDNRRKFATDLIAFYHPDVWGVQEALAGQVRDMEEDLPAYGYTGVGRDDGENEGEFSAIFYDKEKYTLLESATWWLSATPDAAGSIGWDAACSRIVTWAKLENNESGKTFFVFNTHFDHRGQTARKESARLLLRKINEIAGGSEVIVTGDFNATPESAVYEQLTTANTTGRLVDCFLEAQKTYGPEWTFTSFGQTPVKKRNRIDYVFARGPVTVVQYVAISEQRGDLFPSDHLPVMVTLEW